MTNSPRPDAAPKGDERPQAKGEKSPLEKMRDLTRRVIRVPKEATREAGRGKPRPPAQNPRGAHD
jgi:hypothetical protein